MVDEAERDRLAAALSDHELGRVIGRGQFGVVWSARHIHLSRQVAVKRLTDEVALDVEHSARFRREARTLAQLDHKHVVAVHDYREVDGMRLLIMELLDGGTLGDRGRSMPVESAVAAALAAAAGLHHAHTAGVLHRDVKPENLMFDDVGVLKVTDFGLARADQRETRVDVSRVGTFFGTPAYVAPEQAAAAFSDDRGEIDQAADQYSLAAVLYETLSGRLTHDASGGGFALCQRRMSVDAAPLDAVAPSVPSPIAEVVAVALARAAPQRWSSTEAFGVALAEAATRSLGADWLTRSDVAIREPGPILDAATSSPPPVFWPATTTAGPAPQPSGGTSHVATPPTIALQRPVDVASKPTVTRPTAVASTVIEPARRWRRWVTVAAAAVALGAAVATWLVVSRDDHRSGVAAPSTTITSIPARMAVSSMWSAPTGGNVFSSPALTPDLVLVGSEDGALHALDRASGAQRWSLPTGKPINSSPAVVGDVAVVGGLDGSVHAVSTATGEPRWTTPLDYEIVSSPVVADGTVVVGANRLYGLDLTTGTVRWSVPTDSDIVASPAIDDGIVVIGTTAGTLYGVSLADGAVRWSRKLDAAVQSSPRVGAGTAFVATTGGTLHAVRLGDGTDLWSEDLGSPIKSSPLVTSRLVAVGTDDGRLVALDASTGETRWTWRGTRPVDSSPALGDGWITVGSNDRDLHVVDIDDGTELGRFHTGGPVLSSPRVDGGVVYVGSFDDRVYALRVSPR